jgi:hypothetical protein
VLLDTCEFLWLVDALSFGSYPSHHGNAQRSPSAF